jgi:VWFA-related protein
MRQAVIAILFLILVSIQPVRSQSDEDAPIKVSTILANVPVIVSDRTGKHVAGIKPEDFKITSAGNPKEIVYFSDSEMPLNVAIILDITGSVSAVLEGIKIAAKAYVNQLGPDDKCMVVTFGDKVKIREPFTSDKKRLTKEIKSIIGITGGIGLMNEAVLRVVKDEFAGIKGRKAIILLTDAGEINRGSTAPMLDELIEGDTVVYTIFYPTMHPWFPSGSASLADLIKLTPVGTLADIAAYTGGKLLVADGTDFTPQFQTIMDELKKMYIVGFYPEQSADGSPNKITMNLVRPDLVLRTKKVIRPRVNLGDSIPKKKP